ncbi:MAG: glycerophosphodiester phosphodiesterase family protein [Planctomycetaceae bacterium]
MSFLKVDGPARVVAHRGVSALCPENTRRAFQLAVECGADAIECDLQLTSDDRIVICHDYSFERYGHPGTVVHESPYSQLKLLDMGSWFGSEFHDQRLLLLEDLLNEFGGRIPLLLEVKAEHLTSDRIETMLDCLLSQLRPKHLPRPVAVLCFDISVLERIHRLNPDVPLVLNTLSPDRIDGSFLKTHSYLAGVDGWIDQLNCDFGKIVHQSGMSAMTFTCDDDHLVRKAVESRVDFIITNDPVTTRSRLQHQANNPHAA